MSVPILEPNSPGLYRIQRGRPGADQLMSPDVGTGGRYAITTGEAATVTGGTAGVTQDWRRLFDVHGPSFAILVLGTFLLLVHAKVGGSLSASVSK